MAFQWRRFQFFDKELLAESVEAGGSSSAPAAGSPPTSQLFADFVPACSTSGRGHLIFGDARGMVKVINRDLEESRFQAYEQSVLHLHQLRKSNVLVSVGNDGGISNTTIKIWRMDKLDAEGTPMLARAIKVFSPKFPAVPVTSFSVLEDLSQLALGLGNGAVMLFDGNILRDRNVKQSLIQNQGATVVAVHFREPDDTPAPGSGQASGPVKAPQPVSLFVVSTSNVVTIYTKHPRLARVEIDEYNGCEELLGTCINDEKKLVVTNKNGIFFYEAEERREAYGFDGNKKIAAWFNGYLVLVYENSKAMNSASGGGADGADTSAGGPASTKGSSAPALKSSSSTSAAAAGRDTLTIYDLKNKFIAYNLALESVSLLVSEFSSLFVVTASGRLFQLHEHDLHSKMEKLFKMNLYQISIALASNASKDRSFVMDIFQRYGDHLYSKGDYDGAIQQYLETIQYVEPSYVIRKFLDAQRIHNLTRYLQALHEKGRANTDHTTLLLNCYTKLKDVAKLDEFVKQSSDGSSSAAGGGKGLSFDVLTAINVCRQANYWSHALYLARKHQEHALYLAIQIEDQQNLLDALAYISALEQWSDAEKFAKMYGSKLVHAYPRETMKLFTTLCMGWIPTPMPPTAAVSGAAASGSSLSFDTLSPLSSAGAAAALAGVSLSASRSNPAEFIHLFVEHPLELEEFLSQFFEPGNVHILSSLSTQAQAAAVANAGGASNNVGPPNKDSRNPQTIVCNTLLELYLRQYAASEKTRSEKAASDALAQGQDVKAAVAASALTQQENPYHAKTYEFIKSVYGRYDPDHALVLCKMYSFEKGILLLYDKLRLFHEIVQYHMEHDQSAGILSACKRHGDKVPQLWVQALSHFAAHADPCEEQLSVVLRAIKDRKLLPPLMILQLLAANPRKELGVVKDFIVSALQEENDLIRADSEEIARFHADTSRMREEIHRLHTQPITFQGLKCHQCTSGLSLPAVHFMCLHSFHQRCVADSEQECPKCAGQYRTVRDIRDSMKSTATQHDRFFKRLEEEQDGFSVVAEYFGRGLFETQDPAAEATTGKLAGASP